MTVPATVRGGDRNDDPRAAEALRERIAATVRPGRRYRVMEVCGGHTHAIHRHGLPTLLPTGIEFVHGPGCPVCVLPTGRIQDARWIASRPGVTYCTYGDVLRVPGPDGSLLDARADGADVRMVYSPLDALELARRAPDRQVVFGAIGFETTAPATAALVRRAAAASVTNLTVLCHHVRVVPPLDALLSDPQVRLDGLVGPGHVAAIVGWRAFEPLAAAHRMPVVVAGFGPVDLLRAVAELVDAVEDDRAEVVNAYARVVPADPNPAAAELMADVFEVREHFGWRGLGSIPRSGFRLSERYAAFDAEARFDPPGLDLPDPRACRCGEVLRGLVEPTDCRVFGTACTPEHPIGSCMVSSEGACAAAYQYGGTVPVPVPAPGR